MPLHLGVIGLSPGNGHPYSWSAIFNGYDPDAMEACGFPVIPRYLEKQRFPEDGISSAQVTHVWTQDSNLSKQIAESTYIPNIVTHYTDLIDQVDGVLLARDDADSHLEFARPFLEAGLPVYIDKPLALSVAEAQRMIDLQRFPGQLFSCSALRYAQELRLTEAQVKKVGEIHCIHAHVPKDWDKYAIHIIEPSLNLLLERGKPRRLVNWRCGDRTTLHVEYETGVELQVNTLGATFSPLGLRVCGSRGWCDLMFSDTFAAFRSALEDFVNGIVARDVRADPVMMLELVSLIEAGRRQ